MMSWKCTVPGKAGTYCEGGQGFQLLSALVAAVQTNNKVSSAYGDVPGLHGSLCVWWPDKSHTVKPMVGPGPCICRRELPCHHQVFKRLPHQTAPRVSAQGLPAHKCKRGGQGRHASSHEVHFAHACRASSCMTGRGAEAMHACVCALPMMMMVRRMAQVPPAAQSLP